MCDAIDTIDRSAPAPALGLRGGRPSLGCRACKDAIAAMMGAMFGYQDPGVYDLGD